MNETVLELIKYYFYTKNEVYFEQLLTRFQPVMKKYAKKLYYLEYEDSMQELSLAVYDALQNISYTTNEFACISYLNKAIYHKFCKLYMNSETEQIKKGCQVPYEDLCFSTEDDSIENKLFLYDLSNRMQGMSSTKKRILLLLVKGYTDKEIGKELNCSRQYINRVKKSIFFK